ncbi:glycine cleavage system protein GcvH [Oceanotoga sp. DSM 15011]|jgi:glycine cleavage system H protein|uniref:Glycine cleavage system H protein n=1 Tax=Oceanotoga teriensis TaxID=515440 RepID=A0AA45C7M0_9BACT|nr:MULTISPECIES: glycine cleavage system protein GcvH [Oceanotoga]MDN5343393.1 glycine cleavage system protein [Oceanotoga sp.]MDO7976302.1 glycine cleavage system protein GcvH [Oceanotoga teriensis]PWJ95499.1 glycine cleavage system H protein [Oceanotoga teriensis]UYP01138.1 glycine cleavage system protein GcvH [Oceanotoga sp. DSM 15011]
MKKFAESHEYVIVEGNVGTVGISVGAADELGDITYVDLPEVGKEIKKGDAVCSVESVKSAGDIYSPVSGKIIEVNSDLEDAPEKINEDAEGEGWIYKIELSDESELDSLKDED